MSVPSIVALGELIEPARVKRAAQHSYRILSITMRNGLVDQDSKFKKRVASTDLSQYKVVSRNQLVVGFPIDEGVLAFQNSYDEAIVSPAYGIWNLRSPDSVDSRYLELFLRSPSALNYYTAKLRGTTARRRSLPSSVFLALSVPLPSLDEQHRIAAILDHVDALRAKRRAALAQLEELMQSIFIDMFGDPVSNDRGWESGTIGRCIEGFESGRNLVGNDDDDGGYRVLKVSAVTSLTFKNAESKPLPSGYVPPAAHLVKVGDLLFSRANTAELVGATAFVSHTDGRTALPDKLWRFRWKAISLAEPRYVEKLFQRPKFRQMISDRATGSSGSMKNISRDKVLSINLGWPPVITQNEFARRIEQIDVIVDGHRAALAELDSLFVSLQSRAFRGEL